MRTRLLLALLLITPLLLHADHQKAVERYTQARGNWIIAIFRKPKSFCRNRSRKTRTISRRIVARRGAVQHAPLQRRPPTSTRPRCKLNSTLQTLSTRPGPFRHEQSWRGSLRYGGNLARRKRPSTMPSSRSPITRSITTTWPAPTRNWVNLIPPCRSFKPPGSCARTSARTNAFPIRGRTIRSRSI